MFKQILNLPDKIKDHIKAQKNISNYIAELVIADMDRRKRMLDALNTSDLPKEVAEYFIGHNVPK